MVLIGAPQRASPILTIIIMEENNQPSSKDNFQLSPCFKDSLVEQSTLKH